MIILTGAFGTLLHEIISGEVQAERLQHHKFRFDDEQLSQILEGYDEKPSKQNECQIFHYWQWLLDHKEIQISQYMVSLWLNLKCRLRFSNQKKVLQSRLMLCP